ncbi:putative transposase Ptta/En/Spm plant [Arabidopsis suecica]|uniref:Putative transposase Ptta/En/Spm plant n=1 Tax=Arabidopsis suecica TaxID=45249 RepID=A0A8T1YPI4_ARASU|nr:putative transposase Ptta/En/Spm plant [Arabidopsis suecica]
MSNYFESREWMDRHIDPANNRVSEEFREGVEIFIRFACNQQSYMEQGNLRCPCSRCRNIKRRDAQTVSKHLYRNGFKGNYYVWTSHGENCYDVGETSAPRENYIPVEEETWDNQVPSDNYDNVPYGDVYMGQEEVPNFQEDMPENVNEEPYHDNVFQAFEAANQPLYDGCIEGISQLSLTSRVMNIKSKWNLAEACVDEISQTIKDVCPKPNKAPASYYETKKLTRALGLPVQKIDVCEDNCMLFWKGEDRELMRCRFCKKDRYYPNNGKGKNKPKQRMFYLPIADRLKRLYQSEATASHMRWHAEHISPEGEMHHPSDGAAWKHFQEVYPTFANESRNIYLGLSSDGFNPIGMNGEAHSIWPVIVTPYNLPPGMCMKKEYFYLAILVPGPKHPKKSLDIFLQPLIEELQSLWKDGVDAYDVSKNQNFKMRAALMWTISDFPAYGMLSGWMTHGRLACPYCLDETKSHWLPHGRKHSWFDCHRRFLPKDHPYRRNKKSFRRGVSESDDPPPWLTGEEILHERINNIEGLYKTVDCGGNGHDNPARTITDYGVYHNWVKKSIFWELPYWENLLLRHNLDFMHIEKYFFDNLIKTVLNVPGKTKDNIKSRMDLPALCRRPDLELTQDGKAPVPNFRLSNEGKRNFLTWMKHDIKFPDGYASNFGRCVDEKSWSLSGLKSHDCHVIMQRLLPFAFLELLPKHVHTVISEIALFFRDISSKTLKSEDIAVLKDNIAVKICNLEKIFPPSFFDVMEHLPVHLPDEAALGGPVQYRWMYPFERYMYHLKKKVKNKAKIGGSIVAQSVIEEISYATRNHFGHLQTPENLEDVQFSYVYPDIPTLFKPLGHIGGKFSNGWLTDYDYTVLQTFLMLNCAEFAPYESMFEEYMTRSIPDITSTALEDAKENHYAQWVKDYINDASGSFVFPLWMLEFVQGPRHNFTSWPMYYTRGYHFHTHGHGKDKRTQNYGVCVRGTTKKDYYGLIEEIIMIDYHGAVGLKTIIFKCRWFDTTEGRGMRTHPSGIVDVAPRRRYEKYDPFVLPEQCDQVCFIPYPRLGQRTTVDDWWACTKVIPRGVRETLAVDEIALQDDTYNHVVAPSGLLRVEVRAVEDNSDYEDLPVDDPDDEYVSEDDIEEQCKASPQHPTSSHRTTAGPHLSPFSSPPFSILHLFRHLSPAFSPSRATLPNGATMPPGATGLSSNRATMPPRANGVSSNGDTGVSSNGASSSNSVTLEALINAPARRDQPRLHPKKLNGALWFKIDPSVNKYIRTTWQSNFMGRWWNWTTVPQEKKDEWWQDFVQNYYWEKVHHNLVYLKWKTEVMDSVRDRISSKKRDNKKPVYIGQEDWDWLMANWGTEEMLEKSKTNSENRMSDPDDKGIHKHCAGPVAFAKIEYDMSIVEEVEETVSQLPSDGSPNATNQTAIPSHTHLINQTFLEINKPKKGRIYGMGSAQDKDVGPNETSHASLARNLDTEMRLSNLETTLAAVKDDMAMLKNDVLMLKVDLHKVGDCAAAMQASQNVILRSLGIDPLTHQPIRPTTTPATVSHSVPSPSPLQPHDNDQD